MQKREEPRRAAGLSRSRGKSAKLGEANRAARRTAKRSAAPSVRLPGRLAGLETLDLSVADPRPTAHFSFMAGDGTAFQQKAKDRHHSRSWQVGKAAGGLQFKLALPDRHGVVLILNLCRTLHGHQSHAPLVIDVNGEELHVKLEPHNLTFHERSWYLSQSMLVKGENRISLKLGAEAKTDVVVKAASVMRFDVQRQQRTKWCWAAITTSILGFFHPDRTVTQCQVVQRCLDPLADGDGAGADCCRRGRIKACNRTFKLVDALDEMGLSSSRCNYPLTLDEVREQIHAGVPVAVRIGWRGGGGHFVVVTAVADEAARKGQTWLRVADPLDQAASYVTYDMLKHSYKGQGTWTHTYLLHRERVRHRRH